VNTPQTHVSQPTAPTDALKVLVVEDDADCREALEGAVLSLGHSCSTARDGIEAWERYEADRADVILSDWQMPRMDGFHLCQKVRGDDSNRSYTHFIFITGNADKAHFIHGMRAGADDYIAKPVDLDELEGRLAAAQRIVILQRDLRQRNSSLRHESERAGVDARTDPLTGAFNRLALKEDLEALAARASRYGYKYAAALCDVDDFKAYNDQFGHLPGDDVLRRIVGTIHDEVRRGDVLYRYGGDELLVILPEQSATEAARGMDRLREEVEHLRIPQARAARSPLVTISVGVSALGGESGESVDDWLRRADSALYVAKTRGRNCVAVDGAVAHRNHDG
jgi:diguanylate cyclase (GGDEF)-like protein